MAVFKSCSCIRFLQLMHCLKLVELEFKLFYHLMSVCQDRHFLCPKILLPVVVWSYLVFPCQHWLS